MAKTASTVAGRKVIGEVVVRDKETGELRIRFSSEDAKTPWGQRFEAARIRYWQLHRRDKIPQFLRTGKCLLPIKIIATLILERRLKREINKKEVT